ncbi:methylmalonyl-CoA epimerase [Jeotgalibacillus haloalkalitolerans]|uniref:Methylmalonyl-CoA epimerase n=1 Tax=Jeotgalibacillus haloalkalitolerans TaxID=3104292 RepID=A0ABU5KLY7_9BACL|nr:methylmalonyl-CoA epimerase [Jeotgalibacillus sp. HH7-29]MDZ5712093.1 methylmalonyl-CoA epimerase [Jeotgalibacillus sp. HH7-29]
MKKTDHIGVAVKSIENALPFYTEMLALTLIKQETVESQGVKVAFLDAGNIKIELLEPVNDQSPIARFIEKKGEGIHHVAFGVENIDKRMDELTSKGLSFTAEKSKPGAGGAQVAFLHPKQAHGVLYELCDHSYNGGDDHE